MQSYKPYFHKAIAQYYPDKSSYLQSEIESAFHSIKDDVKFASHSSNPMDKRMDIAGYFLATVKVLDKQSESFERIQELLVAIAKDYVRPKNRFHRFLKKLAAKIVSTSFARMLLRKLDKKVVMIFVTNHRDGLWYLQ